MHEKTGFSKVTQRHSGVPAFRRSSLEPGIKRIFPVDFEKGVLLSVDQL
jgi:hypothetical protein